MDNKQIEFMKELASLFYERIQTDAKFRNDRIKEWCDKLPAPRTSKIDSTDAKAIDRIAKIHHDLEKFEERNSVKGYMWPIHIVNEHKKLLELLYSEINRSDVDDSVMNIYYVHRSVGFRACGKFEDARKDLGKSTELMQKKIESYGGFLPRYSREIMLNSGCQSELYRIEGDICEAIKKSEEMLAASSRGNESDLFRREDLKALCPIEAWALYYCCEAHLAVEKWDEPTASNRREWFFTETFSGGNHKNWTVPVKIKIIGSDLWRKRYPHYFNEIANILYIGTSRSPINAVMREISVYLGRVRLKPTVPVSLAALIALLLIHRSISENRIDSNKSKHVESVKYIFDRSLIELGDVSCILDGSQLDQVKKLIDEKIEEKLSELSLEIPKNYNFIDEDPTDERDDSAVALAVAGSFIALSGDRGIGVG